MRIMLGTALNMLSVIALSVIAIPGTARGQGTPATEVRWANDKQRSAGDSLHAASAAAAVKHFRDALARGDSAAALALLAPDVIVIESGDVETRDEYRLHHLPADIEFARAVPSVDTHVSVAVQGDVAWVSTTSTTQGQFKGRAINAAGAELVVLSRRDGASPWQIRAIHWSSHRRTP